MRRAAQAVAARVTGRLPVVTGAHLTAALGRRGWVAVRQRGSHVRLKHPERSVSLVVPLRR